MSSTSSSSTSGSSTNVPSTNVQALSKRRSHTASNFFGFCVNFMEEWKRKGRQFRNDKQAFETAALCWHDLSTAEKEEWKDRFHQEKASGNQLFKIQNGDRGPSMADPAYLAYLKDKKLKSGTDIGDLIMRWGFRFERKADLASEPFLIVSASQNSTGAFSEIAIVRFTINIGIIDQFRISFGVIDSDDLRLRVIEYVLDWPRRVQRRLNDGMANFFVPAHQIPAVFGALTFVGSQSSELPPINWQGPQIFLRDLASVEDLQRAMHQFVNQEQLMVGEEVQTDATLDTEETDCLDIAQRCVGQLVERFRQVLNC